MGSTKTKEITGEFSPEKEDKNKKKSAKKETKQTAGQPRERGQKYKDAVTKVDKSKLYATDEAIKLVKETDFAKFVSSIELHIQVKKDGLTVNVSLPHSAGVEKKVEFADESTIKKLEDNNIDFDILISTPEMMPKLVPFARILGPKGMMPNPKNGTLVKTKEDAKKFSLDDLVLKTERKAPLIHTVIGKVDMDDEKLIENLNAILNAVGRRQIVKAYLSSSMGPSVKLLVE